MVSCQGKVGNNSTNKSKEKSQTTELSNSTIDNSFFKPDSTINAISLLSNYNVESYLGKEVMDKLDKEPDIPRVAIHNNKTKQYLILYFHPGGVINEFSEFEITPSFESNRQNIISIEDTAFTTESGVKLTMALVDFKLIKGEPDSLISEDQEVIYHYEISNMNKSAFLKKYNMPLYYADYYFRNGYLYKYRFGFMYP